MLQTRMRTAIIPSSASVGTVITIQGSGLLKPSRVTFYENVLATTFTVNSDTQITVTIPSGAKTGPIQVTTSGGTATSEGDVRLFLFGFKNLLERGHVQ